MIVKYLLKIAMLGSEWVMYLLVLLSVASIAVMVERVLYFRKHGKGGEELGDELLKLLEAGDRNGAEGLLARHSSLEAEVLHEALRWAQGGPEALSAAIDGEMQRRKKELESGMTLLSTLGSNAPFIGLMGTVIGVIVAFADLAEGLSKVQMDKVMGGIAEALVATAVGLFVAIPAVVAYNVFQKMIGDVEDNLGSIRQRLCALLTTVGTFGEAPDVAAATSASAKSDATESTETNSSASLPEPVGAEE